MRKRFLFIVVGGITVLVFILVAIKESSTKRPHLPKVLAEVSGDKVTSDKLIKALDEARYFRVKNLECQQIRQVYQDLIDCSIILARYESLQVFFEKEVKPYIKITEGEIEIELKKSETPDLTATSVKRLKSLIKRRLEAERRREIYNEKITQLRTQADVKLYVHPRELCRTLRDK